MSVPQIVKCPTCRKAGEWWAGGFGPFCSPRCRLIDLGGWLKEEHVIASPLRPEVLEEYSDLPPGPHLDQTSAEDPNGV